MRYGMKTLNWSGWRRRSAALKLWFCGLLLVVMAGTTHAAPPLNTADPNCFFTTVASRLLKSEMGMNLSCIQVYPTNQYTPAVHRLLQVTANIYDCTTTNYYPSVFRPLFWKTNELVGGVPQTNIYVVGYQYVPEPITTSGPAIFTLPTEVSDPTIPFGLSGMSNNIYGIPWILGVKKGLPNFNALEMENVFSVKRTLQFNRNSSAASTGSFPYGRVYTTNQMYVMSISNYFGVEFWNSYASNYTGTLTVVANDMLSVQLTNDSGGEQPVPPFNNYPSPTHLQSVTNVISWSGYQHLVTGDPSFIFPLMTNTTWLTNSVYYYGTTPQTFQGMTFAGPGFIPIAIDPSNYLDSGTPPLPNFGLQTTNRLQAYILDTHLGVNNVYILDYVQLNGMDSSLNVNAALADPDNEGLWSTNSFFGGSTPFGVNQQYLISSVGGIVPAVDNDGGVWANGPVPGGGSLTSPTVQQAFFSAFFSANNEAFDSQNNVTISNLVFSMQAPFTPTRHIVQRFVYAANDPLVHYTTSDLEDFLDNTNSRILDNPLLAKLTILNDRYAPWGAKGNFAPVFNLTPVDTNPNNLAYKDPGVKSSDNWNFPTNEALNASWLGQVHRGTPWQTIYLKSTNILNLLYYPGLPEGLETWAQWTGGTNLADAASMAPVQDWHMASELASLFETNYASLFSVNDRNPNDWKGLLNGMAVLTNDLPDVVVRTGVLPPQFAILTISSNSTQAAAIANAIEAQRTMQPLSFFTNIGDIFAIPSLSDASPYLNVDAVQVQNGINDIAYEAIPSQLLPLLRMDSIGSVTPASGYAVIQFTGDDNHVYAIQISADLIHWTMLSTHCPVGGSFTITNTGTASPEFYRTVLVK